jgi:putative transposase
MPRAFCCCAKRSSPRGKTLRFPRTPVPGTGPATGYSLGQWRPLRFPSGLFQVSRLSVWWLRLGIAIERIRPGHPQQNSRHERMHLTLKQQATRPVGANFLQQEARFDTFVEEFNHERPHEALGMKRPGEGYTQSPRIYNGIPEPDYPFHDRTVLSPAAAATAFTERKSISQNHSRVRL